MGEIELSCGLPPGPGFADLAVHAEDLGYARVWVFDSAPLWEDPFVHLALAAERTSRIGLATAVLIPSQRSVMAMASGIATIARISGDRFRACFGTGGTAHWTLGQPAMSLNALFDYVGSVRRLLAGETVVLDGQPARMLHWPGVTADRPVQVPLWLSVFGPRGYARAHEVADGIIGRPHPELPSATMMSGTVLDPGEDSRSNRVLEAIGPWAVIPWHAAYQSGGAAAVDELPGGADWRATIEALARPDEHHLHIFEGHSTHLTDRDRVLLEHLDVQRPPPGGPMMNVGDPDTVQERVARIADAGYREVIYLPSGPDPARELSALAAFGSSG